MDRPIRLTTSEIKALRAGIKTQHRVALRPQPFIDDLGNFVSEDRRGTLSNWGQDAKGKPSTQSYVAKCVRYAAGDRLWLQETWTAAMTHGWTIANARSGLFDHQIIYKADDKEAVDGWWSAATMPREFSRITLLVNDVTFGRLQQIRPAGAIAEGIEFTDGYWVRKDAHLGLDEGDWIPDTPPLPAYCSYWNDRHARRPGLAWEFNPWVAILSFETIEANIGSLKARNGR